MWILNVFQVHKSVRIYIAHFSVFNCHLHPSIDRSLASWHYPNSPNSPNSPKNGKPALSPRHDWLNTGSLLQNVPLRIWFYPQ
ncbi:TPA: serine/threonine protein kinase [Escherichia coli]|nr:serine/threonine protein kinase [Escherichia coli]EHW2523148.1 serine/threonine protein kinase [Escherichia coli]EHY3117746.1 serine/threonine protein kinase [Escherichia coli]HAH9935894.1 serine/threonine protein kinase [Escherichia coli]HDQ6912504.1 serine/threonine protein kinase [Escherichia coli O121:H19]